MDAWRRALGRSIRTPDIALTLAYDAETLYGSTADVTLTASNAGGPDSYNLSFNTSVGPGMSLSGFSLSPTQVIADAPVLGDTTYIWENAADLPTGGDFSISFMVAHTPGHLR